MSFSSFVRRHGVGGANAPAVSRMEMYSDVVHNVILPQGWSGSLYESSEMADRERITVRGKMNFAAGKSAFKHASTNMWFNEVMTL